MSDLFADTAGWGHLVDPTQPYHSLAVITYHNSREQGHKFITTNYIISELVALLTSPLRVSRSGIVGFINSLKASPHVEVVHVDPTLDEQAWHLLTRRQDKDWSLVDCSSFVIMQQRGITEALTTDIHFEQAGFVRLLN